MLAIGDQLPKVSAPNQDGKEIHLQDFIGNKLVVFFYPKAMTPGCTAEACNISENYETIQAEGYTVVGVSADSIEKQKKFHDKYQLKYDLLADEEKKVINAFGVWGVKKMYGREYEGIYRTTFLFNEKGECSEVIKKVKTKDATNQIVNTK